jgi:hypothetical protein
MRHFPEFRTVDGVDDGIETGVTHRQPMGKLERQDIIF